MSSLDPFPTSETPSGTIFHYSSFDTPRFSTNMATLKAKSFQQGVLLSWENNHLLLVL